MHFFIFHSTVDFFLFVPRPASCQEIQVPLLKLLQGRPLIEPSPSPAGALIVGALLRLLDCTDHINGATGQHV